MNQILSAFEISTIGGTQLWLVLKLILLNCARTCTASSHMMRFIVFRVWNPHLPSRNNILIHSAHSHIQLLHFQRTRCVHTIRGNSSQLSGDKATKCHHAHATAAPSLTSTPQWTSQMVFFIYTLPKYCTIVTLRIRLTVRKNCFTNKRGNGARLKHFLARVRLPYTHASTPFCFTNQ